jgi:hypothetical protein
VVNYNFLVLSPVEFENLCRDLLQEHLNIYLESFSNTQDAGVDFRYAQADSDVIVQCKRYGDFDDLFNNLKREVVKAAALQPKTYILITSAPVSVEQKNKIIQLFNGIIKLEEHIYNNEDLNNLLGKYPHIEKRHFKLWLTSINILERILHNNIHTQTEFEIENIYEAIKVFVENESYYQSLKILENKRFVVISGNPGVGKTTLSRILVCHFINKGYQEFHKISQSISEAYHVYKRGVKQVFLFDDFLGGNYLKQGIPTNEESRIIEFIEKVNKSKDKIIVFNAREYILNHAINDYEKLNNPLFNEGKYMVDLNNFTKEIRAKILYNHIIFSNVSKEHISSILKNNNYNLAIEHKNFNPRIIEQFFLANHFKTVTPEDCIRRLLKALDNPSELWAPVYKKDLSKLSQILLAELATVGDIIFLDDLKRMVQAFCTKHEAKYNISYIETDITEALQQLEGSFLKAYERDENSRIIIGFMNSSVKDFMIHNFSTTPDLVNDLIESAIFYDQLFNVFINAQNVDRSKMFGMNSFTLSGQSFAIWEQKVMRDCASLDFCTTKFSIEESGIVKVHYSIYYKLYNIALWHPMAPGDRMRTFVVDTFYKNLFPEALENIEFDYYVKLLFIFYKEKKYSRKELLAHLFDLLNFPDDIREFAKLRSLFKKAYEQFVAEDEDFFEQRIQYLLCHAAEHCMYYDLYPMLEEIHTVIEEVGVDCPEAITTIEKRIEVELANVFEEEDTEEDDDNENADSDDDSTQYTYKEDFFQQQARIKNMFDSLRNMDRSEPDNT